MHEIRLTPLDTNPVFQCFGVKIQHPQIQIQPPIFGKMHSFSSFWQHTQNIKTFMNKC